MLTCETTTEDCFSITSAEQHFSELKAHMWLFFAFLLNSASGGSVVAIDNKIEQAMVSKKLIYLLNLSASHLTLNSNYGQLYFAYNVDHMFGDFNINSYMF